MARRRRCRCSRRARSLVSWWSTSTPLWYAQKVEGLRPDILIVDDRTMLDLDLGRAPDVIERYLAEGRPVYAIRLDGRDLEELQRRSST